MPVHNIQSSTKNYKNGDCNRFTEQLLNEIKIVRTVTLQQNV